MIGADLLIGSNGEGEFMMTLLGLASRPKNVASEFSWHLLGQLHYAVSGWSITPSGDNSVLVNLSSDRAKWYDAVWLNGDHIGSIQIEP